MTLLDFCLLVVQTARHDAVQKKKAIADANQSGTGISWKCNSHLE
jgi:hypothetical protein